MRPAWVARVESWSRRLVAWAEHLSWWLQLYGKQDELKRCLSNMQEADESLKYAQEPGSLAIAQAFNAEPVDVPELVRAAREELEDGMKRLGALCHYQPIKEATDGQK